MDSNLSDSANEKKDDLLLEVRDIPKPLLYSYHVEEFIDYIKKFSQRIKPCFCIAWQSKSFCILCNHITLKNCGFAILKLDYKNQNYMPQHFFLFAPRR